MYSATRLPARHEFPEESNAISEKPVASSAEQFGYTTRKVENLQITAQYRNCDDSSSSSAAVDDAPQSQHVTSTFGYRRSASFDKANPLYKASVVMEGSTAETKIEGDSCSSSTVIPPEHVQLNIPATPDRSESRQSTQSGSHSSTSPNGLPKLSHRSSYNPLTGHSSLRKSTPRREIMGMSVLAYSPKTPDSTATITAPTIPTLIEHTEASLEIAANSIRLELMRSEIEELAIAVERAAESGQDSFAVKPCLFQDDLSSKSASSLKSSAKPTPTRRSVSEGSSRPFSTGRLMAIRAEQRAAARQRNKLSVVELRDVNEVFPSFRQFQTHLRTHFFRSEVSKQQLCFKESDQNDTNPSSECRQIISQATDSSLCSRAASPPKVGEKTHNRIDAMQQNFLRTFSLDQWVPSTDQSESAEADMTVVGDMVSGHLTKDMPACRPKIEVPPGLETNVVCGNQARSYIRRRDKRVAEASHTLQTTHATEIQKNESCLEIEEARVQPTCLGVKPVALFDTNDDDDSQPDSETDELSISLAEASSRPLTDPMNKKLPLHETEMSQNSLVDDMFVSRTTHTRSTKSRSNSLVGSDGIEHTNSSSQPSFVTPAKLRKIRDLRKVPRTSEIEAAGMILPSNSLSENSPMRQESDALSGRYYSPYSNIQMPRLETVLDVSDSMAGSETKDLTQIRSPRFLHQSSSHSFFGEPGDDGVSSDTPEELNVPATGEADNSVDRDTSKVSEIGILSLVTALNMQSPLANSTLEAGTRDSSENLCVASTLTPSVVNDHGKNAQYNCHMLGLHGEDCSKSECALHASTVSVHAHDVDNVGCHQAAKELHSCNGVGFCKGSVLEDSADTEKQDSALRTLQKVDIQIQTVASDNRNDCVNNTLAASSYDRSEERKRHGDADGRPSMRRSTSTGALEDSATWNDLVQDTGNSESSFVTAMNIISRISPSVARPSRERTLSIQCKNNDDFINNFLYCSKFTAPPEAHVAAHAAESICAEPCEGMTLSCGEANAEFCWTGIVHDAVDLGLVSQRKQSAPNLVKLSSNGISAARGTGPGNWIDTANEKIDVLLNRWAGTYNDRSGSMMNFQAPSLKKTARKDKTSDLSETDEAEFANGNEGGNGEGLTTLDSMLPESVQP